MQRGGTTVPENADDMRIAFVPAEIVGEDPEVQVREPGKDER